MATKLKVLRAEHDLTQAELASVLGTTQKVVSSWETGNATPRPAMMQRIEDYFDVPKEEIFFTAFNYSN
ncbi:helix-turn-helix transcriptional regulator [Limosilactobacillus ingluviei]|uniref:helix-turn-helix transcriptional regulator n=1 Tax=Limosilactobacillus ingluviei TaxID=148604 RepID=UPI00195C2008|nr:helix-turn-helix transcriptional regulator [Limosilactobacillus ingluviei]MBM6728347.1 helix-turn-helix transcriptional regulator [Limosilactobacillus ingluviei]